MIQTDAKSLSNYTFLWELVYFRIPLNTTTAEKARDSLVKGLYGKLFNQVVQQMNNHLSPSSPINNSIGMLDIAGFGEFEIYLAFSCYDMAIIVGSMLNCILFFYLNRIYNEW